MSAFELYETVILRVVRHVSSIADSVADWISWVESSRLVRLSTLEGRLVDRTLIDQGILTT